ncbi:retrovirus-related Pol polyprotein from transposon 297 [Tribolium castaneum]|uniref:retrovirus-related Pol polyprotein from transposon 297 n=1 Tax=Tribolium castaneum TaxID=7070 RepID=UPI0030FF247A
MLVGLDANAVSPLWHSKWEAWREDERVVRGRVLEEVILREGIVVLNSPSDEYTYFGLGGQSDIDVTLCTDRTPIYLIVRYPRLKVVDMENNRNTGNVGAPPQEMPTWFVRWLNSQQPRNAPNFAAPSTSTAVQRPLVILQVRPSTSAAADADGWQVTPLPSDGTTSPEPDPEIPVAPEPAPLASPLVQEPGSSTTSATSGAVMASPPMPITTDNVAAISGVLRSLLDRPFPAPERPSFEGLKRQNPVKFLRAIEEYGRSFGLDSKRLLGVAMDCLKGNAKHWTGIFQKKWRGYEDFRRDFLRTYWSAKRQRDIRFQIATGRYDETRGTMLSHFAYYVDMANMLTTPLAEEVLLDELLRHFPERIQSLWVLEKICTTTDAAEFLAAQEIPGQNPGEKTNIAPRERPHATDHQLRNEPKRPRPNIDRHEVTRPVAPANRGNGFQKRSSDNQQWRNNQPSTSNNRWHNNNGNNSNNHWRKNNPNDNRNNTRFGKRGRSTEQGLRYSGQQHGPQSDSRNQQLRTGEKRKRSTSSQSAEGENDARPRASQVKLNVFSIIKSAVAGNNNEQRVVPEIKIQISQQQSVTALLDTGSEVSCISEEVWSKLIETGNKPPTLPVTSIHLRGAIGQRSCQVVIQCYLEIKIDEHLYPVVTLVVKNLIKPTILGADWLNEQRAVIDFDNNEILLRIGEKHHSFPFRKTTEIPPEPEDYVEDLVGHIEVNHSAPITTCNKKQHLESPSALQAKVDPLKIPGAGKRKLIHLLQEYRCIFSSRPGLTHKYTHEIKLHDKTPFLKRPYPVPFALRPAVDATIQEMLDLGVIKREASPYASPMTVVKKKDGTVRICLDARMINSKMIADCESPPAADELLRRFHGIRYMSTIELRSSYWQIPLSPESRQYTAFLYNGRSYTYQVLPFGLKTAVGSFSRAMDVVLGTEVREFVVNYIDDLLVASETLNEHLEHLRRVFEKLKQARMTINLEKSNFIQKEVKFLGHILTINGIKADPEKVSAIRNFPVPQKTKHVRAFLGLCNFYRKFCARYSAATQDLNKLLRKGEKWRWGRNEQEAFDRVKDLFLEAVLLHYPDLNKIFYVQTDSSGYGLGAELYQIQEDGSRGVIAFASRSLKGPELNYTTTEKELLGVIFALHKFRIYIQATKIIIRTDHQALKFLSRCRLLSERLTRWTLILGQYDYEIELVKGKDNVVADILSRYPSDGEASYEYPREQPIVAMFEVNNTPEILQLMSDLKRHQSDDPVLSQIIANKQSGAAAPDARTQRVWSQYNFTNNVLVHRSKNSNDVCLAIPESLVIKLVDYHHQLLGHFGATKVYNSMKREYYWPNMYRTIKKRLRSCDLCQKTKSSNRPHQGPLTPILYDHIGDLVCVDFYGPLPTGRLGASYVFVVIDVFSKFLKLYPLRKATAKIAAKRLIEDFSGYIKPKCVLSDHGTQFISNTWQNSLRAADIQPTLSSIRHPESNPSERVMRELGRIFRSYCRENHASWVNHLSNIEDCLNYVPHISTGFSPYEILYGRTPPNPLDAVTLGLLPVRPPLTREEIHKKARENLRHHANLRQKNQKGEVTVLKIEDWVLLKNKVTSDTRTHQFAKFMPLYSGPYKIIAKPHPNTYQIADPVTNEIKGVYNMTNLKFYHRRDD